MSNGTQPVVNAEEADTVVALFRRYLELRSVHALRDDLAAKGVTSKRRCRPDGSTYGGQKLGRGGLYAMLQNRIYRGEITHKDSAYPGEHPAILEQALWDQVQARLKGNRDGRASGCSAQAPALLGGTVFDAGGKRLTPTHAIKNGTRYRYYASASLVRGHKPTRRAWRIPASDLDGIVIATVSDMLHDPMLLLEALDGAEPSASPARSLIVLAGILAKRLSSGLADQQRADLITLGCCVVVEPGQVKIQISRAKLLQLPWGSDAPRPDDPAEEDRIQRTISVSLKRVGREMRMVEEGAVCRHTPDPSLLRLLGRAHDLHGKLSSNPSLTVRELAAGEQLSVAYVYRLLRLRWLAPDIVVAIVNGRQPSSLNATVLMHQKFRIPTAWSEQRRHFGTA